MPLLLAIKPERSLKSHFSTGFLTGLLYYGYGLYWILYYSTFIYLAILFCHILFFGLFLGLTGLVLRRTGNLFLFWLAPALVWTALSLIYEYSPLGAVGTQALFYQPLEMMQISRYLGIYAVVFLFLLLNSSFALVLKSFSLRTVGLVFISLSLLFGNFLWGKKVMAQPVAAGRHSIALIQHDLPTDKAWWLQHQPLILEQYRELALQAAQSKPSLIVFPSYSLPFDAYRNPVFFEKLARETQSWILVSTYVPTVKNRRIAEVGQYEMALLYSPEKGLVAADKAVQGPPFRRIHEVLGEKKQLLETPAGKMGVLLCFEDALSVQARHEAKAGADFLAAISNPSHFIKTFLPEYHLFQDQLRAIETGKPVIRVSAKGYTAIIDRLGRFQKRSDLEKTEILIGEI